MNVTEVQTAWCVLEWTCVSNDSHLCFKYGSLDLEAACFPNVVQYYWLLSWRWKTGVRWAHPGRRMNKWGELSHSLRQRAVLGPSYRHLRQEEVVLCCHRWRHVMTIRHLMAEAVLEKSITILFHILCNWPKFLLRSCDNHQISVTTETTQWLKAPEFHKRIKRIIFCVVICMYV